MPRRILVVDDERTIRDLVCEVLEDEGFTVLGASNGSEALALIEQGPALDLVVLDMWMPVMNGWQFAAAIAERGIRVPIVVMTAAREARDRAQEIGAVGYIGKPFDVDQFVASVQSALTPESEGTGLGDGPVLKIGHTVERLLTCLMGYAVPDVLPAHR